MVQMAGQRSASDEPPGSNQHEVFGRMRHRGAFLPARQAGRFAGSRKWRPGVTKLPASANSLSSGVRVEAPIEHVRGELRECRSHRAGGQPRKPPSLPARNRAECEPYLSAATRAQIGSKYRDMSPLRGKRLRGRRKRNLGSPFPGTCSTAGPAFSNSCSKPSIRHGRGSASRPNQLPADSIHWLSASRLADELSREPSELGGAAPAP